MNVEDFVLMRQSGGDGSDEYISGGYKVNSFFLNGGMAPMMTMNTNMNMSENQEGGKVSSPFEYLAVPAGLYFINQKKPKKTQSESVLVPTKVEPIEDNLYDKLLDLMNMNKHTSKTRRHKEYKNNNKTKRNT
jgi:hypothetical protein